MKREFLKELGLEDEAINKIMAENGKDIEGWKSKHADTEQKLTEAQGKVTQYESKVAELEKLSAGNADLKKQLDDLNAKIAADKAAAEKAAADKELTEKIIAAFGDKEFVNDYTKNALINEIKTELIKPENSGKGISEIFTTLTTDRKDIFANPNPFDMDGIGKKEIPSVSGVEAEFLKRNPGIKL
jgi:DNA repair exonuclease SbcCD ATPase subunit